MPKRFKEHALDSTLVYTWIAVTAARQLFFETHGRRPQFSDRTNLDYLRTLNDCWEKVTRLPQDDQSKAVEDANARWTTSLRNGIVI